MGAIVNLALNASKKMPEISTISCKESHKAEELLRKMGGVGKLHLSEVCDVKVIIEEFHIVFSGRSCRRRLFEQNIELACNILVRARPYRIVEEVIQNMLRAGVIEPEDTDYTIKAVQSATLRIQQDKQQGGK